MADTTPQKRALPARERRESAAKRRASSPAQTPSTASTPAARKPSTAVPTPPTGRKTGYIRGPYKKRSAVAQVQTPTSASRSSPSVSTPGDGLPMRMLAKQALPTTKDKQPAKLSLKEYQSIAESATLAASLFQSRMQWLCNGIFEKYYVKKRKGVEVPPNNPDVKSMQRLGAATMTVEPHTFDVLFYVVKEFTVAPAFQRPPNPHVPRPMGPPSQHGPYPPHPPQTSQPPPHPPPTHPPPTHPSAPPTPAATPPATVNPSSVAQSVPTHAAAPPAGTAQNGPPPIPQTQEESARPAASGPSASGPSASVPSPSVAAQVTPTPHKPQTQAPQPVPKPTPPPPPPPPAKGSTQDPVIQMLAARAASDSQLKELMKIVATSRATPQQLKEFQSHIDEFNEVIRRQEAERVAKSDESRLKQAESAEPVAGAPPPPATAQSKPATSQPQTAIPPSAQARPTVPVQPPTPIASHPQPRQQPAGSGPGALPGVMHTFPTPPPAVGRGGPMSGYAGYPQPAARPEPFIKHVVMEITSMPSGGQAACPDRWLFPEYAVLEMRPNGLDMICSFLVERKGSQIVPATGAEPAADNGEKEDTWKAEQEYYQPVTMTIRARDHKTIQTIAKAAKTLPTVQEHMKEVMGKKQRAPVEYLVHQLPREKSHVGAGSAEAGFVDSGVEVGSESASEDDELKDFYGL